jgi:hypothetical protein
MKRNFNFLLACLLALPLFAQNEEATGLPGDQFSLEGALELFKNAASPEEFENLLNKKENEVNNLDVNGDNETDYVKVISKKDGDAQILILQVSVSENENQDIAVINIEKTGREDAVVQIVGDEDIYGEEMIVEPSDGTEESLEDNGSGPSWSSNNAFVVVNVWTWPSVRFIYSPTYRPWVSPWRWRVYPNWWRPWRPLTWSVWHPLRVKHYRPTVRVVHTHRVVKARTIYKPVRVTSTTVRTRHASAHANYKVRKTTTTVKGPRGNAVTKKSTTVKGPKGNVRAQKTTVKKSRRGN